MNEGSDVYSCLIDASKAFDRVHWGKLFSILIEKNVSYIFLRLILTSDKEHVMHGVFLDLNPSYLIELNKAGFYLIFSLLYILRNLF